MTFSVQLGRELSDSIKNLVNKDVVIFDDQYRCVAATDNERVGKNIALSENVADLTSCKEVEVGGLRQTLIPLRYKVKNAAYLLFNEPLEEMNRVSSLIKSFAELLIQQHHENNKPILDSTDQFVLKLFNNYNQSNEKEFEQEANLLGYDTSIARLAIVIHLSGFWEKCLMDFDQPSFERDEVIKNWKRNIENSFNSFFTKNADLMIAYVGNDKFVIFKSVTEDENNLRKLLKKSYKSIFEPLTSRRIDSVTVGFGNAYTGVSGLISSYREGDISLELGERMWGGDKSYYFGELGILSILGEGDRDKKMTFANQLLGRLKNEDLGKTLECFFENNLNLTETADKMGIHRNTVIYRLNQITKTLDADPRIFEQAMSIKIALLIKSLFG